MTQDLRYRARALVSGADPPRVCSEEGPLDLTLSTPEGLGGRGGAGTNPEQLLAAGYAACFHAALRYAAGLRGRALPADVEVRASVEVALGEAGGFGVEIGVEAAVPSWPAEEAQALIAAAADLWPYSGSVIGGEEIAVRRAVTGAAASESEGARGYGG
jgi:lipoyl-dependent peroxiredoxin